MNTRYKLRFSYDYETSTFLFFEYIYSYEKDIAEIYNTNKLYMVYTYDDLKNYIDNRTTWTSSKFDNSSWCALGKNLTHDMLKEQIDIKIFDIVLLLLIK